MAHTELGQRILDRLVEDLDGLASVEQSSKLDGRNMVMVVAPTKKPAPKVRPAKHPKPDREAAGPVAEEVDEPVEAAEVSAASGTEANEEGVSES